MADKVVAIVQARLGSTRLPNKVLKTINGKSLIEILLNRLSKSEKIDQIILAIPDNYLNDKLSEHICKLGYEVYRGSEDDVLSRYFEAAKKYEANIVVRITGDCPIIEPLLVDKIIEYHINNKVDYTSNINPPTFPDGLDTEVFTFESLKKAHHLTSKKSDREHVTPFIRRENLFSRLNYLNHKDYSNERWTVDEPEDFVLVKNIIGEFDNNIDFKWTDVIKLKKLKPEIFETNKYISRNEGSMPEGQKLWNSAKRFIPGGNMLLSKRAEMFLPDLWPSYYSKAKGCNVWDLDGNRYIDMSIMGIGTNILGYCNEEVDNAVRKAIELSNMSTLNCPEEVELAQRLVKLHPWSDMVRFARTGGEANSIAIRIARASTGKDKIAVCGYHGWHDWYLSANLKGEENLEEHLLPGLSPNGVPKNLKDTTIPFNYNDFKSLKEIVSKNDIAAIKMEVFRNVEPKDNFLEKVRKLASDNGIILIFDECTSAFRINFGGIHKNYNIEPDMAIFGKAIGNGYALTAVIGRRSIMQAAQSTFISSTFWTERIGPSAALKTLEVMKREKSWAVIVSQGKKIIDKLRKLGNKNGLKIIFSGLPSIINFSIKSDNWLKYKTFLTQEMLKKGYLASNLIYVSTEHNDEIIDKYIKDMDSILGIISECENGRQIEDLLEGPTCHSGFKRLN